MLTANDLAAIAMAVLLSVCRSLQLKCRSLALIIPLCGTGFARLSSAGELLPRAAVRAGREEDLENQLELRGQAHTLCGAMPDYIRQLADADYVDSIMRALAARETPNCCN